MFPSFNGSPTKGQTYSSALLTYSSVCFTKTCSSSQLLIYSFEIGFYGTLFVAELLFLVLILLIKLASMIENRNVWNGEKPYYHSCFGFVPFSVSR